ncbi:MAG: hypothetical protein KDC85_22865 [Saprospiraceae bacterium]|nr:hypothetical protein [Saprospiraceae bacterium]
MNIEKIKGRLKNLIKKDQTSIAIQELEKYIPSNKDAYDEIILLGARSYRIKKEESLDRNNPKVTIDKNILDNDLMTLINKLNEDEFQGFDREITYEKFFVVTPTSKRKGEIEEFFPEEYFPNCEVIVSEEIKTKPRSKFIIFDFYGFEKINSPESENVFIKKHPALKSYLLILSELVKQRHFIIYLGNHYYNLDNWREQVHAANSKFALYARIREMIEYLKYNPPIEDGDIIDPEN